MDPTEPLDAASHAVTWTPDGRPHSRLYGDVYFSAQDGLAESRTVFLQGCGLPEAWRGLDSFVVAELGFGTGLNVLALLDLWRRHGPANAHLSIFTVEAHPLSAEEAARALAPWSELADLAQILTARWPGRAQGFHRVDLPELNATLDVAVMEVGAALRAWSGSADAWFLDGFSPALNPAMWRTEVLALVAARSAPGARAATFTVAGAVRRGLADAGFEVAKRAGFGRKRERLEAVFPGGRPAPRPAARVAIVGAGIAGAAAARAIRALGGSAQVFDAQRPGAGASGNPAALVTPRLDAGLEAPAQLFARAFARATTLLEQVPDAVLSRGVLQYAVAERDGERFAKILGSNLFEPRELALLDAGAASALQGEPAPPAMELARGLVISPAAVLQAWLGAAARASIAGLRREGAGWSLLDESGAVIASADVVILAAGLACRDLWPGLPLAAVRGQVNWAALEGGPAIRAAAWGGYLAPLPGGVLFGATHDRADEGGERRPADDARNLATLAKGLPRLAERLGQTPLEGRAAIRAVTPDFLPLAGAAPGAESGLHLLSGMGARGFVLAPLLAEHVAAQALGRPSPLAAPLAEIVAPSRFKRRAASRGHA